MAEDRYQDGYMQDTLEFEALDLGGQAFLDDIHLEAAAHIDEHYPWDGRGDEPPERVSAYLAVLWQRIELERGEQVFEKRNRHPWQVE